MSKDWTYSNLIWLKLLYRLQSNGWSSLVSVATVLVISSGSSSFSWHHCFVQLTIVAMLARLATQISLGLRWTFLGSQCWQGFRHLWRVSVDPSMSFPVFLLLCWQLTSVFSCALLVATVVPMKSWSNDRFCQFCHHVRWVSAFWDELRKLRPGVLNLVLSCVRWVPHDISLLHSSLLTSIHLAVMPRCTLLFWCICGNVKSQLWTSIFQKIVDLLTSSLFLSNQSPNHLTVLNDLLTVRCPVFAPLLPKIFWEDTAFVWWKVNISQAIRTQLRQTIGQISEFFCWNFLLSSTADSETVSVDIPVKSKNWRWFWFCFEVFHNFRS